MAKQVKLPKREQTRHSNPGDAYPNEGIEEAKVVDQVHENNYFKDFPAEDIRRRYMKFSVMMEGVNESLDLSRQASVDQFALRVRDLVLATQKV